MNQIFCSLMLMIGFAALPCVAEGRKAERPLVVRTETSGYQPLSLVRAHEMPTEESRSARLIYNVADRILGDAPVVVEHTRPEEREKKGTNLMLRVVQLSF